MKVYQNLGVNTLEEVNLPKGTIGFPYRIEEARILEGLSGAYDGKDILDMTLRMYKKGEPTSTVFQYFLVGEKVYKPFMGELGAEGIEALVGEEVFALVNGNTVHGLVVPK